MTRDVRRRPAFGATPKIRVAAPRPAALPRMADPGSAGELRTEAPQYPRGVPASRGESVLPVPVGAPGFPQAAATVAGTHEAAAAIITPTDETSASGRGGVQVVSAANPAGGGNGQSPPAPGSAARNPGGRFAEVAVDRTAPQSPVSLDQWTAGFTRAVLDPDEVIRSSFPIAGHVGGVPVVRGYPGRTGRGLERGA